MKNLSPEFQALGLLSANTIAEAIKHALAAIEPMLNPILVMLQIGIAAVTIIWIWRRAKGAKLDNEKAERDLDNE